MRPEPKGVQTETPATRRGDWFIGAIVALVAFGVYLRTLFPGLGGGGDSAKFQYVGSVLGTAASTRISAYVFVSFCFAQIPFGTLAWRINAMSAFFATVTVVVSCPGAATAGLGRAIRQAWPWHWPLTMPSGRLRFARRCIR